MIDQTKLQTSIAKEMLYETLNEQGDESGFDPKDQYLTFYLHNELYGVSILRVEEIRGWEPSTEIPNAPGYVVGVINIRGTIVPVFDLRTRFGLEQIDIGPNTVIIILRVYAQASDGTRMKMMGIVVDGVSGVHVFSQSDIQFSSEVAGGSSASARHVKGVVDANDKMAILLDVDKVMLTDGS